MNRTFLRDFLTGLTALAGLAGLVLALMLFGELRPLTQRQYSFLVQLDNAGGLVETGAVLLNGVKVGTIAKVVPDPKEGSIVTVKVRQGVGVPRGAGVSVNKGFVGDASIDFSTLGLSDTQLSEVMGEGELLRGGNTGGLASSIEGTIREMAKEPIEKLARTADSVDELAKTYTRLGERLTEMTPDLKATLSRLDATLTDAQGWLSDTKLRERVDSMLGKVETLTGEASGLMQEWTRAGEGVREATRDVTEQARVARADLSRVLEKAEAAMGDVRVASEQLAQITQDIRDGKGTLGQLATNPDLYRNLDDAASRLDRTLEEARLLIEKYRAEGVKLRL